MDLKKPDDVEITGINVLPPALGHEAICPHTQYSAPKNDGEGRAKANRFRREHDVPIQTNVAHDSLHYTHKSQQQAS